MAWTWTPEGEPECADVPPIALRFVNEGTYISETVRVGDVRTVYVAKHGRQLGTWGETVLASVAAARALRLRLGWE